MAATLGLAAALLMPAVASADTGGGGGSLGGASISIGSIRVVGKLIANVTVNVTCDPLDTLDPDTSEPTTTTAGIAGFVPVQLMQAQGRTIDTGFGEIDGVAVVCDGTTVNPIVVSVLAQSSPWHSGAATGWASAFITDSLGIGADGATIGPVQVRLSGK